MARIDRELTPGMDAFFHFLQSQPFFTIFGVVAIGVALGRVAIGGVALGSVVCIILAGLTTSILAFDQAGISLSLPDVLKTIFFNLFIFSVGVKIGPQFFAGLERDGWHMVAIGAMVAVLAPVLAIGCAWLFDLPQGAAAGLLAGSNNSSASFGTASSAVQSGAVTVAPGTSLAVVSATLSAAFALCYTVSEVQYVLFMKWLPKGAGVDPAASAREFEASVRDGSTRPLPGTAEAGEVVDPSIAVRVYRLPATFAGGLSVADLRTKAPRVTIELVRRSGAWAPATAETRLSAGDAVVIGAPLDAHLELREALGPELPDADARALVPVRTADVVVSRDDAVGRAVSDVLARVGPGVYPNAVFRAGAELPTGPATVLKKGDVLRVTATEPHIASLGAHVGQVIRGTHTSDVLTLSMGLLVGAALGAIPVPLFGVQISFGAAAVLVTGIVFGWLKTRHPALGGPISEGARDLMEGLGLYVFTAVLAINSGEAVFDVIRHGPVLQLIVSCLVVSSVPALVAWWVGRHALGLNPALLMGAIAGARQNTASLHVAQQLSASAVPGIGYPVPLAITTMALSVTAYFFAIFL